MGDDPIIYIEDCGVDLSWRRIVEFSNSNPRVKGFKLSRNFGQHHAITAGLDHAKGQWIVVMDCDLQDQPEEIARLFSEAKKGNDIVILRRINREEPFLKRISAKLFLQDV